jgi:hypothetical protein
MDEETVLFRFCEVCINSIWSGAVTRIFLVLLVILPCNADELFRSIREEAIAHFYDTRPVGQQNFDPRNEAPFTPPEGCQSREVIDARAEFSMLTEDIQMDPLRFIANSTKVNKEVEITEETAGETVNGVLYIRKQEKLQEVRSKESYTVCLGHEVSSESYNPDKWIKEKEALYRKGTSEWKCGKSGDASLFKNKKRHVWCRWKHPNNHNSCSNKETKAVEKVDTIKKEEWVPESQELLRAIQGTSLAVILKDVEVSTTERKLIYTRVPPTVPSSLRPAGFNCTVLHTDCVDRDLLGCLKWSSKLRCQYLSVEKEDIGWMDGTAQFLAKDEEIDKEAFTQAVLKLELLNEIKSNVDAGNPLFFSGDVLECSKSSVGVLDCCNRKGLAIDLYLKECSANELRLSKMKEKGLCRLVGTYQVDDGLGLIRNKSAYCCFSSRLIRVFQEQSRNQLSISWGEGRHPDCRGLSVNEFSKLDLNKIDLSDAIDIAPAIPEAEVKKRVESFLENMDSKMESLQKREEWKQAYGSK